MPYKEKMYLEDGHPRSIGLIIKKMFITGRLWNED